jgi:hypothetical protein
MLNFITEDWREHLVLTRDLRTPAERNQLYRSVRSGALVAICRGAFMRAEQWSSLDSDGRYLVRLQAAACLSRYDPVFSHHSAAALWRLPVVGQWPRRAHVLEARALGGVSSGGVARHTTGLPSEVEVIDGLTVTTLARTVVDIARACPFGPAVTMADAALRRTEHPREGLPRTSLTREELFLEARGLPLRQSTVKVRKVIEFADAAADRPGESMSRVSMLRAGITPPRLQEPLLGASGRRYFVDFCWPEFTVVGEFDGKRKYWDPEFLRGRTSLEALEDEKAREDDLRAAGHGMARWGWETAVSPRLLAVKLASAGVR